MLCRDFQDRALVRFAYWNQLVQTLTAYRANPSIYSNLNEQCSIILPALFLFDEPRPAALLPLYQFEPG